MISALKRLNIYFKEMYPIIPRLILGYIVFAEIYFIVLLNSGVDISFSLSEGLNILSSIPIGGYENGELWDGIQIISQSMGIQELILGFTIFSFLCWLRIADDFKDYELDCRLFAHRPLPSGRVTKKDLGIFVAILIAFTILVNFIFMPKLHFLFCVILYTYGSLMAVWFFQKHKIQKSLPKALVTHNPVQMIMNIYIISFVIIKYDLPIFTLHNVMAVFTLYFPALIWEVSRKIRAPQDETEYVTYSKLFGYKKAINFVFLVTWMDIITNFILVWNLSKLSVIALLINVLWISWKFIEYKKDPTKYKIVDKVEKYTYIQESLMLLTILLELITNNYM